MKNKYFLRMTSSKQNFSATKPAIITLDEQLLPNQDIPAKVGLRLFMYSFVCCPSLVYCKGNEFFA